MGLFACLSKTPGCNIPESKRDEFAKRMEKLFQSSGMMEVEVIQLYGEQIELLRKPTMHDYGIEVYYNYFEDSRWENAGFCPESYSVWSESIENLKSERYLAFWKVFEDLLHDPELKAAGDVIFVPDGPEYERMGVHDWRMESKRRLIRNWDRIDSEKRKNKGRITLRRYLALMANRALREKVFEGDSVLK